MNQPISIHVALTFDDPYWAPAYAVMRSVCLYSPRRKEIAFHLFHRPLTEEHRADLMRIESEFGATLVFYDIDDNQLARSIMQRAAYNERLSNIVYARLMFEEFLPPDVPRIIYLDCDMMLMRPIEMIYDIDMQGRSLAAAPDFMGPQMSTGRDMVDARGLFDLGYGYFNAGMILVDLARWREKKVLERLDTYIENGTLATIYYDQDFLNLEFRGDWLELDPKWNFFADRPLLETLNPYLLHYVGETKPWHLLPNVCFAKIYRHTMTNEIYYRYLRYRWKKSWRAAWKEIRHARWQLNW